MFSRRLIRIGVQHETRYWLLDHKKMHEMKESIYGNKTITWKLKLKFLCKESLYTLVQGFKDLWADSKWYLNLKKTKPYTQYTGFQIMESERYKSDMLKFIPYFFLIIIPLAQLALPALLWLFPNMVPSFFIFDTSWDKQEEKLQNIQFEAHKMLIDRLMQVLTDVYKKQPFEIARYQQISQSYFEVVQDLHIYLDYKNFSSDQLIVILQFLGNNYITGVGILNKIVNLFSLILPRGLYKLLRLLYGALFQTQLSPYKDPFFLQGDFKIFQCNYFPLEILKRRLLLYQINKNFKILYAQDVAFDNFGMEDIKGKDVKDFARIRGLAAISCYITLKNFIKKDWVRFATNEKFKDNNNAKLWYSVLMYNFLKNTSRDFN